jgi:hypothetical protein
LISFRNKSLQTQCTAHLILINIIIDIYLFIYLAKPLAQEWKGNGLPITKAQYTHLIMLKNPKVKEHVFSFFLVQPHPLNVQIILLLFLFAIYSPFFINSLFFIKMLCKQFTWKATRSILSFPAFFF